MKWITQFKQENVFPKKIDNWLPQKSQQFYIFFEMYKQCVKFLCQSSDKEDFFYIPFVTFIAILELISLFGLFQNVQSTPK